MPSYKLTARTKIEIVQEARRLLELRVSTMETGFPLTHEQVVEATVPVIARECFAALEAMGCESLNPAYSVCAVVAGDEVRHPALIEIGLKNKIYAVWDAQSRAYYAERAFKTYGTANSPRLYAGEVERLMLDMSVLPEDVRARLIKWVNNAARERRIGDAAIKLVDQFLEDHCNSTGELNRRWPGLRIVFSKMGGDWPARMRDTSRVSLSRWAWPTSGPEGSPARASAEWYQENCRKMEGASSVLAGAGLMDTPTAPTPSAPAVSARILKVAR
jgi:hypothetical protein